MAELSQTVDNSLGDGMVCGHLLCSSCVQDLCWAMGLTDFLTRLVMERRNGHGGTVPEPQGERHREKARWDQSKTERTERAKIRRTY